MAFNQTAARPLFSRNKGAAPTGVQMARQLRTGLRPAPPPSIDVTAGMDDEEPVVGAAPQRTVRPVPQMPRPTTPNAGGTIERGGLTRAYAPTPAANPAVNSGGTITRPLAPGLTATTRVPPTPSLPATPTTSAAPQTESNNPLTGDTNREPGEETTAIDPAKQAGFSARGSGVPAGNDAVGGAGLFARKFASPQAADIYSQYVRRLFSDDAEIAQ